MRDDCKAQTTGDGAHGSPRRSRFAWATSGWRFVFDMLVIFAIAKIIFWLVRNWRP